MAYKAPVRDLTFFLNEVLEIDRYSNQRGFAEVLALLELAVEIVFPGRLFRLFLEVDKDLLEVHVVSHFLFEMGRLPAM